MRKIVKSKISESSGQFPASRPYARYNAGRGGIIIWLLLLVVVLCCIQDEVPAWAQKSNSAPSAAQRKSGQDLIKAYQCVSCHIIDSKGAKNGISLDKLRRSRKFVVEHLLDPEEHVAKNAAAFNFDPNIMPSHQLTLGEAQAMADYLLFKDLKVSSHAKKPSRQKSRNSSTENGKH